MCGSCAADRTYDALSDLREEIDRLDAEAANMSKEELVIAIDAIAKRMWM